jgi:hypothetical protein
MFLTTTSIARPTTAKTILETEVPNDNDDGDPTLYIIPTAVLDAVRLALLRSFNRDPDQYSDIYRLSQQLTHAEPIAGSRFENTYRRDVCDEAWTDIWMSDDVENECASCGKRHLIPIESVELMPIEYHRRPLVEADKPSQAASRAVTAGDEDKTGMEYDVPIVSPEHFAWCCAEAERRYDGKVIRDDESGMLLCEDDEGVCHTDAVLRALSSYKPST